MTVVSFMTAIFYWVVDIIGHFVTGVGHEILPFLRFSFAEQPDGDTGREGSSKGCQYDGLGSLHTVALSSGCNLNAK